MIRTLFAAILAIGGVFLALAIVIVANKAWREARDGWRRARRSGLEPAILSYAHGEGPSALAAVGWTVRRRDRVVIEQILLDHVQRVRGIERERLGRALDELGYVERYLAKLRSRRWWTRADGAERLGLAGAKKAVAPLVEAMEDEVPEVRMRAAKALGAVGGTAAVAPLVQTLREPNRWSTIRVADILSEMKQDVVGGLFEAYPGLGIHGKLAALDVLGRVRSLRAVPWLRERLHDGVHDVRARAAHALGQIGDPDSGRELTAALSDAEWPVRAMAAKALGRIRHVAAVPNLCEALRDREWWVRANAAEALRQMGEPGIAALEKMLDDGDVYARHQAVLMLEESGFLDRHVERLVGPLPKETEESTAIVRRFIRAGQVDRLHELSEAHADPRVRNAVATLLARTPPPKEKGR